MGNPVRRGEVVVIRSTWDYIVHPAAFVAWLDHLDGEQAIVHNPTSLLRWNAHKGYLVDLARRGLPVVPTALVARGDPITLDDLFRQHGWDDVVIKPAVGGTARFTEHAAAIGATPPRPTCAGSSPMRTPLYSRTSRRSRPAARSLSW